MNAFINNFNLITWPERLAADLTRVGCTVIFIDNNSTYEPLLQWYRQCPYKVHYLDKNFLSLAFWKSGIFNLYNDRYYILTDSDVDISSVPEDFISILLGALGRNENIRKAALSIEINDLPDNLVTRKVIEHENLYWSNQDEYGFYQVDTATTLAVYDRTREDCNFLNSLRAPRPYTLRHLPWYLTKLTPEIEYQAKTTEWDGWISEIYNQIKSK